MAEDHNQNLIVKDKNYNQFPTCCISMNMADRLRLLALPLELIPLIRGCITHTWGKILHEGGYYGAHEFKLRGYPWHGTGEDAINSRRLLTGILTVMAKHGWNLIQSTGMSKKDGDKDSLFFELGRSEPDAILFSVSFNMGDTIRIIDAPGFMPYLKQAVEKHWPKGIQSETENFRSVELKLNGFPWYPWGQDEIYSKMMLAQILSNFRRVGYKLYASIDISADHHGWAGYKEKHKNWVGRDLETWIFRRVSKNWK